MSQRKGLPAGLLKLTLLGVLFAACGARVESPPGTQANAGARADATPKETRMADEVEIVMLGKATFAGGRLTLGERWLGGEGESGIKPGMVFDVLNCAGFVARARVVGPAGASREEQYGWRVEVVPESARADAAAAQGRCAGGGDSLAAEARSRALAVYPSREGRNRITVGGAHDLSAVYASLPDEARKCHAAAHQAYPEYPLGSLDSWTDVDGDGKIDLVVLTTTCDCTPQSDLLCQLILRLSDGKWRQMARITPA